MKTDARPDRDEEPEREELRALLRSWQAPGPPPGIEAGLRREFRRRRQPARRVLTWGALAAGLALLVAGLLAARRDSGGPAAPNTGTGQAAATTAPTPVPHTEAVGPTAVSSRLEVAAGRPREPERGVRDRVATESDRKIVVEPGQAELLAQLGRRLWETQQAAPATEVVAMPEAYTPTTYRAEWQPVAGVWPQLQQSVSDMGR
jgi:hypothetical protein